MALSNELTFGLMETGFLTPTNGFNILMTPEFGRLLFGGDYNPEQWKHVPGALDEDMRLMRLAHVNAVAIGIFSWAELEPEEGRFEFAWMDDVFDRLEQTGVSAILATPSGAKPAWMAAKYEEIRRIGKSGLREPQNGRHNHCPTSPVYREKVRIINGKLAERYQSRPNLVLWHLSNEYGGYCYCNLCFTAFREWLKVRYNNDLEALNQAWWTRFWSHTYTEWEQINHIDSGVHGLHLDWKRFMTDQCADFMQHEIKALREAAPDSPVPVTTNFMGTYEEINYHRLAPHIDVISWDSYPDWHNPDTSDADVACHTAFNHDLSRGLKDQPFLLMECTPSLVNWQAVSRPKRPGVHRLAGLQAVAHGSDSVLHFQWRKSRGSTEKFHGAIVDHVGDEHNRIFREAAALGAELETLASVAGSQTPADVALIYDWENRWAIDVSQGPRNSGKNYEATVVAHYKPFWTRGIAVDVVDSLADFDKYRVVVAPMLYMLRPGVAERLEAFVKNGGTLIATYLTGIANESDLVFLGGFPGPLRPVFGVWAEETDILHDNATPAQTITPVAGDTRGLTGSYAARQYSDVIHAEGAQVLATYDNDYYAGSPAVTVNAYGSGEAYYIASRNDDRFTDDLIGAVASRLNLLTALPGFALPSGVTAQTRQSASGDKWVFLQNYTPETQNVDLPSGTGTFTDASTSETLTGAITLAPYGARVLQSA